MGAINWKNVVANLWHWGTTLVVTGVIGAGVTAYVTTPGDTWKKVAAALGAALVAAVAVHKEAASPLSWPQLPIREKAELDKGLAAAAQVEALLKVTGNTQVADKIEGALNAARQIEEVVTPVESAPEAPEETKS